jgi:tetratricopeptide (TPR) repeat protein
MRRLTRTALLAVLLTAAVAPALSADMDRREAAYREFRQAFDAQDYAAALPLAWEVTRLIERDDPLSRNLPNAYNNLGVVQFRTGDQEAAEQSFRHALQLLEGTEGIASRKLISPLAGLGAVYAAQGRQAEAAEVLQRALAISRRAEGLFNLDQLGILDALVRSYEAAGMLEGVERELRYALQVVQQRYDHDDPRCLPAMKRLAEWYERTGNFAAARALWTDSVKIASREGGGRNAATINGLLGIARTHRLQFVRDPESLQQEMVVDPLTGRPDTFANRMAVGPVRLDRAGEAAAQQALAILDATTDPPKAMLVSVLIELGDWYITAHEPASAVPFYQRAGPLIPATLAPGEENLLARPRPVSYRLPPAALRSLGDPAVPVMARGLEFSLAVAATGEVTKVTPVSRDAPDNEMSQVGRALDKAWFSPRFEDGQPVATDDFHYQERWFEPAPMQAPDPAPATEAVAGKDKTG